MLRYEPGLSRVEEAVVSSHFMEGLAKDASFRLYRPDEFRSRQIEVAPDWFRDALAPLLLRASRRFAERRAALAPPRARQHHRRYGLARPCEVGVEHEIAEALFDRQFVRGPREMCSREDVARQVKARVDAGEAITMVIPALPYKFSSPLKCRGPDPDLGEANFLLTLAEIVWTVEHLYRAARPASPGPFARFVVVSDGSRFSDIVGVPAERPRRYRRALAAMIDALAIGGAVVLVDYLDALRERLPAATLGAKRRIAEEARRRYAERMWPVFDPGAVGASLRAATAVEPDPEAGNPQGRFASLLKSLAFTIEYRCLEPFDAPRRDGSAGLGGDYPSLYRDLTAQMFPPEPADGPRPGAPSAGRRPGPGGGDDLRAAMLREAWQATIAYLAEIKSDRDLPDDPVSAAFPGCVRWTIHPKLGQLALLTSRMAGSPIQCWAGSGALRRTKDGAIALCTSPALALEGRGALPVVVAAGGPEAGGEAGAPPRQPLFYLESGLASGDLGSLVADLGRNLTRVKAT